MPEPLPFSRAVIETVRQMRQRKGISGEQLARLMTKAGYSIQRPSIASAENGRIKEISVDWVWAASEALHTPVKMILFGPDCRRCSDAPPTGFTCNHCGKGA